MAPEVDVRTPKCMGELTQIEALICWKPEAGLLGSLSSLRLIQATGAGVDAILADTSRDPAVPIGRTIDVEIAHGMAGYVGWAVLDHFRGMSRYRVDQAARQWNQVETPSPATHTVGFAGVGALGIACLRELAAQGFATRCWSRQTRGGLPSETEQFTGAAELDGFLRGCNTLVCLLPLTGETRGFLGKRVFDALPVGAHVINVARGEHLVEADLLAALDSGRIARATLDVFTQEPLPAAHAFWGRGDISITPHIAARAGARSVAEQTLMNLAAIRQGGTPRHAVDSRAGY